MIFTNKVLLPILLSYMRLTPEQASKLRGKETLGAGLWARIAPLATRRGAVLPLAMAALLVAAGLWQVRTLKIGDMGRGVPELRADSRYNRDVDVVTGSFAIGVDLLQVIAEAKGDDSPCVKREVQDKIEGFDFAMRQVEEIGRAHV